MLILFGEIENTMLKHICIMILLSLVASVNAQEFVDYEMEFITVDGQKTETENVTLEIKEGLAYFQGDIFIGYVMPNGDIKDTLNEEESGSISTMNLVVDDDNRFWPDGIVPFDYSQMSSSTKNAIDTAMGKIEAVSGVRFAPRNGHSDYIKFTTHQNTCSANVGRIGGQQFVRLANYCQNSSSSSIGTIIHELMHSLGFRHTHSRADRNSYIQVHYSNIQASRQSNYDIITSNVEMIGDYDPVSIMHYGRYVTASWAVNPNLPVITRLDSPNSPTGNNNLSVTDIDSLTEIYGALPTPNLSGRPEFCKGKGTLSWTSVLDAEYYELYYRTASFNWYKLQNTNDLTHFTNANETRYYAVSACTASGNCSKKSNSIRIPYYDICL